MTAPESLRIEEERSLNAKEVSRRYGEMDSEVSAKAIGRRRRRLCARKRRSRADDQGGAEHRPPRSATHFNDFRTWRTRTLSQTVKAYAQSNGHTVIRSVVSTVYGWIFDCSGGDS